MNISRPLAFSEFERIANRESERRQYERYLGREAPLEEADRYLGFFDSYARRERMVWVMFYAPPARRVSILSTWNSCDAPWPYRSNLADLLRRAFEAGVNLAELLEPAERAWFESLPLIER
jgi:hypothetical protein